MSVRQTRHPGANFGACVILLIAWALLLPALFVGWLRIDLAASTSALPARFALLAGCWMFAGGLARAVAERWHDRQAGWMTLACALAAPFAWQVLTIEHPTHSVGVLALHGVSACGLAALGVGALVLMRRTRAVVARSIIAAVVLCLPLTGALFNAVWLRVFRVPGNLYQTLGRLNPTQDTRVIVFNVPQFVSNAGGEPVEIVRNSEPGVTFAQLMETRNAAGSISGFKPHLARSCG